MYWVYWRMSNWRKGRYVRMLDNFPTLGTAKDKIAQLNKMGYEAIYQVHTQGSHPAFEVELEN